jgi:hypothetical protein
MPEDFRKATSELLAGIDHPKLAKILGCSVATLRQARLDPAAKAHRNAPEGWQAKVAETAVKESDRLQRLAKALQRRIK